MSGIQIKKARLETMLFSRCVVRVGTVLTILKQLNLSLLVFAIVCVFFLLVCCFQISPVYHSCIKKKILIVYLLARSIFSRQHLEYLVIP